MKEQDVEIVLQRAREKYPQAWPAMISDNSPQFIAKDFAIGTQGEGVHSDQRHDPCQNVVPLSTEQWEIRTVAWILVERMHPSWDTVEYRRCPQAGEAVRGLLQQSACN